MEKTVALIVAGGAGTRMGGSLPKQFLPLNGEPVLMHTLRAFHHFDQSIQLIVVLPADQFVIWKELCSRHSFELPHELVSGGSERFFSVKNGLDVIGGEGIVFIHDGVRPLVSSETIGRCYQTAVQWGNAIPVMPLTESLRETGKGDTSRSVDRSCYVLVQTPQTFRLSVIREAYQQEYDPAFTDDASVLEYMDEAIHLVEGNFENIKITRPIDLAVAEALLK